MQNESNNFYAKIENHQVLRQQRTVCKCVLNLPDSERDRVSVKNRLLFETGILLAFTFPPYLTEKFPYDMRLWEVKKIIQFPSRYHSREPKYPAMLICEFVKNIDNLNQLIEE